MFKKTETRKPDRFLIFTLFTAILCGLCKGLYLLKDPISISVDVIYLCSISLVTWFLWLQLFQRKKLNEESQEHPAVFWMTIIILILLSLLPCILPAAILPAVLFFLLPMLLGSNQLGIIVGMGLLLFSYNHTCDTPEALPIAFILGGVVFLLYSHVSAKTELIRAVFVTILLDGFAYACLCMLHNGGDFPVRESIIGFLLSACAVFGISLLFYSGFQRKKDPYQVLNDTNNPLLSEFRDEDKLEYLKGIHTAYLCEKIAKRLGWSSRQMICCAYYYRWTGKLPDLLEQHVFPEKCERILVDYYSNVLDDIPKVKHKETMVLVCSGIVINSMIYLVNGTSKLPDYEVIIDAIFDRLWRKGAFERCEITGREINRMKEVLKEEKYYYDSLRRK